MSIRILSGVLECLKFKSIGLPASITGTHHQKRYSRRPQVPKLRVPYWHIQKERADYDEMLTESNKKFLRDVVDNGYTYLNPMKAPTSPLKKEPTLKGTWFEGCMRSGLIAVKLGSLPQWLKSGEKIITTLFQVVDNHVINYIPPGIRPELRPYAKKYEKSFKGLGNLLVGAIDADPQTLTKAYCGLFVKSGVTPKKILTKFPIHSEAIIQPGTPLYAAHFKVGDYVDITGKTIYRGFQGVMKRWGFHGMPASHGQTKTHRRPGNIGAGGAKHRVWPGTKMPGHMGNKTRTVRGLRILRINHTHNTIYVTGSTPGGVNSIVYIHDTFLRSKRLTESPSFPTYYPENEEKPLPEEELHETLFNFSDPTIEFEPEKVSKTRK